MSQYKKVFSVLGNNRVCVFVRHINTRYRKFGNLFQRVIIVFTLQKQMLALRLKAENQVAVWRGNKV